MSLDLLLHDETPDADSKVKKVLQIVSSSFESVYVCWIPYSINSLPPDVFKVSMKLMSSLTRWVTANSNYNISLEKNGSGIYYLICQAQGPKRKSWWIIKGGYIGNGAE